LSDPSFTAYGESFGCLETSTMHTWVDLFFDVARFHAFYQAMGRLPKFLHGVFKAYYIPKDAVSKQQLEMKLSLVSAIS
jgi:hypothetical protein